MHFQQEPQTGRLDLKDSFLLVGFLAPGRARGVDVKVQLEDFSHINGASATFKKITSIFFFNLL